MPVDGVLLAHGAGGGPDHHLFVALEESLAPLPVHRMEFPYRREGRRAPDRPPKLLAAVVEEAQRFAKQIGTEAERLVLGGRSMGGRICSMAVADAMVPAAGLLLLSYPLHPPGKPDQLRVGHLDALALPCLFVSGDRDPFGSPDELSEHLPAIPGPVTTMWLPGERHDPRPACDGKVIEAVMRWIGEIT